MGRARPASTSLKRISFAATFLLAACTSHGSAPSAARTEAGITEADVRSRIYLIADDSMRGRQAGKLGNFMMTSYLAREAARLGLEPAGENGSFFQTVPLAQRSLDSTSSFVVGRDSLELFTDFALMRPTPTLRAGRSLAVTGVVPIYAGRAGDSAFSISAEQATGHIVVFSAPLGTNGRPSGTYATVAADALTRFPTATAIAIVNLDFLTQATANSMRSHAVAIVTVRDSIGPRPAGVLFSLRAASKIFGVPIDSLRAGALGNPVTARISFVDRSIEAPARNVIAMIRGSDPKLRGQIIAIGAHSDHLGLAAVAVDHDSLRAFNRVMRPEGAQSVAATPTPAQLSRIRLILDSLRRVNRPRLDSIYNGADDDGSGSVAELEIAESLASSPRPRRSILFVWHTGEEAGLLGSSWFTDNPTVPRDSIVAQLNMDMVGRGTAEDVLRGGPRNIQVIGARRRSTELGNVIEQVNARRAEPYLIDYTFDAPRHPLNRFCRSDHYMYARYGIPIAFFSRGYHIDYHVVTDEPQYINYGGLARVAGFVRDVAVELANRDARLVIDKPKPDLRGPCRQ
ncbi:MAG: M28 family peptidase [Gemmatimonadaceae bacterium]